MKDILIVDDNTPVLKVLLKRTLEGNKLRPNIATDIDQVKTVLESGAEIFLAIADIKLTECEDAELVKYLIKRNIPTIVLSSSVDEQQREELLNMRIIDYIIKENDADLHSAIQLAELILFNKRIKALILSENTEFTKEMSYSLSALQITSVSCTDEDCLQNFIKNDPSIKIIIVPNIVSGVDGPIIVKRIRNSYKDSLVVFGITSSDDAETRYKFLKSGANDCLLRPFHKEEFNARIMNIVTTLEQKQRVEKQLAILDKNVIISSTDERGKIKYVSEAFSDISKYSKEEMMGNKHNANNHTNNPDTLYWDMWKAISNGKEWSGDIKNKTKDGEDYWLSTNIFPEFEYDGSIIGFTGISKDITNHKILEFKSKELERAQKKKMDSIRFSSLIQTSLLPTDYIPSQFFKDHMVIWEPKDIVGGDIYYIHKHAESCYLLVLDCTGHGVPGAFMTMVVISILNNLLNFNPKPPTSKILSTLNVKIKRILKQDSKNAKSDAGLDGCVIKYERNRNKITFSGARNELFYFQNGELKIIKGDRQSIGYIKSDPEYKFSEHTIDIDSETTVYMTTDGFIDQNGGAKGFPLGKKKFEKMLQDCYKEPMDVQAQKLLDNLLEYQGEQERNDDIALFGFKIDQIVNPKEVFHLSGDFNQQTINKKIEEMEAYALANTWVKRKIGKVLVIFLELAQNIMKYSSTKTNDVDYVDNLTVTFDSETKTTTLISKNTAETLVAQKIMEDTMLMSIMSKEDIKKQYRQMRKSGENAHHNGAGIGFLEIAKLSDGNISTGVTNQNKKYSTLTVSVLLRED
jgi:PAS domain S-box-containing protein